MSFSSFEKITRKASTTVRKVLSCNNPQEQSSIYNYYGEPSDDVAHTYVYISQ